MSTKLLLSFFAVCILTSGMVLAQTAPAQIYIDASGGCGMLNENGDGGYFGDSVEISANSVNGNITLICTVKREPDVELTRSKIWDYENTDGLLCYSTESTGRIPTDDWHEIITPSGNAKLTCHFRQ